MATVANKDELVILHAVITSGMTQRIIVTAKPAEQSMKPRGFDLRFRSLIDLAIVITVASCGPPAVYQPPQTAATTTFSRELPASYDNVWSAVTNVAGATFFNIKNFDKGSGLITLDYTNIKVPASYIDCGVVTGGIALRSFPGLPAGSVLNYSDASVLVLTGTGNVTIRSVGPRRTLIQMNSLYVLQTVRVVNNEREISAQWRFTTRESDTQTINVDFRSTAVTCRPSYKLEQEFLTEVAARI